MLQFIAIEKRFAILKSHNGKHIGDKYLKIPNKLLLYFIELQLVDKRPKFAGNKKNLIRL